MTASHGPSAPGRARRWPLPAAVALLGAINLLNNAVAPELYLLWTSLGVAGLAGLAWIDGLHPSQWGFGRVRRRAARAALVLSLVTAAGLVIGTQLPGVAEAFIDERAAGSSAGRIAFDAAVRAPLGTALFEEVAFRGVLLAMLARRVRMASAIAWSSLAFGAWHLLPALGVASGNAALAPALGGSPALAAGIGMAASGVAGSLLCVLRVRYDHLVVPIAVHATANAASYVLAWLVSGGSL